MSKKAKTKDKRSWIEKHLGLLVPGIMIGMAAACVIYYEVALKRLLPNDLASDAAEFGDAFGALNSYVSGLAFAGLVIAIFLQRHELKVQRKALKRSIAEAKQSSKALTDQVKVSVISAKLAALPHLINFHYKSALGFSKKITGEKIHHTIEYPETASLDFIDFVLDVLRRDKILNLDKAVSGEPCKWNPDSAINDGELAIKEMEAVRQLLSDLDTLYGELDNAKMSSVSSDEKLTTIAPAGR